MTFLVSHIVWEWNSFSTTDVCFSPFFTETRQNDWFSFSFRVVCLHVLCFSVLFFPSFSGIHSPIYFTNPPPRGCLVFPIDTSFFIFIFIFCRHLLSTPKLLRKHLNGPQEPPSALSVSSHLFILPPHWTSVTCFGFPAFFFFFF